MSEKRFKTNDLVKFDYSEIGEYVDEMHTSTPLRNDEVCELLNNYDRFQKWVESLEISKSVELDELLKSINYIFVRYNKTIVDDSDTVELKVNINDVTGFSMELKRRPMSEDIRKWTDGRYTLMFDEHTFFVWDNIKEKQMTASEVTKKLNEQQAIIQKEMDEKINVQGKLSYMIGKYNQLKQKDFDLQVKLSEQKEVMKNDE